MSLTVYCTHRHQGGLITLHQETCKVNKVVEFTILIPCAQVLRIALRAAIKQLWLVVQSTWTLLT